MSFSQQLELLREAQRTKRSYFLRNLRNPAIPARPVPKRIMVAGSGTSFVLVSNVKVILSKSKFLFSDSLLGRKS
jgi:hypothetical protein